MNKGRFGQLYADRSGPFLTQGKEVCNMGRQRTNINEIKDKLEFDENRIKEVFHVNEI